MKRQGTFVLIAMLLAMVLNAAPAPQVVQAATPTDLFFSEYIEGSSYNKALEIYNGTGVSIDLAAGGYNIFMSFNGGTSTYTINLTGTVADGDVYVVGPTNATDPTILAADQLQGTSWFNGDDAVLLRKGTIVVDSIGQVGYDPGTEWGTLLVSTADNTLRRKVDICSGDPDGSNSFVPLDEWDGFANNTFDGLGSHTANCVPSVMDPKINEFSASTTGTDVEFVEIYGTPNTDYSAYRVLEIEGDFSGTVTGTVDEVISLGTTDTNGLFLVNLPANALENGSITLLLVKEFTGALGNDLDTNDDGVFELTPWSAIVDAVAISDGGSTDLVYGIPVLGVSYDGLPFAPGGASRIPDGLDTDAIADWVRNDFDLAGIPGYTGTIILGEAYNTPGAPNMAYAPPPEACGDPYTPIYEIQGSGLDSPLVSMEVALEGIVVGDFQNNTNLDNGNLNGFHVQDPTGDGNLATSDGVFVYYPNGATDVAMGDAVRVRGTVSEYNGMTEVTVSQLWVCSNGNSITPTSLSLPVTSVDDFESYEGMLVAFPQPLVISEYFNYDRYGEIVLGLPFEGQSRLYTPTSVVEPGLPAIDLAYQNRLRRITLDDGFTTQNPAILRHPNGLDFSLDNLFRGGDIVQNTTGVLNYDFGLYRIMPTAPANFTAVNPRPQVPEEVGGDLKIAAMNTLNYFLTLDYPTGDPLDNKCGPLLNMECRGADADQPYEFTRQRAKLLAALSGLDASVIGLNELENTTGVEPLADIVAGLNDIFGAGSYAYIDTGVIGTDAIKVGLIYRPADVTPVGSYAILDTSVDARFLDTKNRPSLAQTFEENSTGARFTVAVNHLKSKGSDCNDVGDPDILDGQGNCNLTRMYAAEALVDWLATDPTGSGDPDFIIMGDLNSYAMEDPIDAIKAGPDDLLGTGDDFSNLIFDYQGLYAYSYVFDGQNGYLDHALANAGMASQVTGVVDWHINADEPDVVDYDTSFKPAEQEALYEPNAYRASDHDAVLVGLNLTNLPPSVEAGGPYAVNVNESVLLSAVGFDPEGKELSYAWDLDNDGIFETMGPDAWFMAGPLPGIFPVQVMVTDLGGLTASDQTYVAVYDRNNGFVTGGGWIDSPAGAYAFDPLLMGKAEFSFDAKYVKKNAYPVATLSWMIDSAGLYFTGSSFDWLVVDGRFAWLRGSGQLNGLAGYTFLLSTVDGSEKLGGDGLDYIRLQIWEQSSGMLVYDSQPGAAELDLPATLLGGGSIVIH